MIQEQVQQPQARKTFSIRCLDRPGQFVEHVIGNPRVGSSSPALGIGRHKPTIHDHVDKGDKAVYSVRTYNGSRSEDYAGIYRFSQEDIKSY